MSARPFVLTPDLLLRADRLGLFPMAESRTSRSLHWLDPEARGILPLHAFHLPRSLMKTLRAEKFHVTADANFPATIANGDILNAARFDSRDYAAVFGLASAGSDPRLDHAIATDANGHLQPTSP